MNGGGTLLFVATYLAAAGSSIPHPRVEQDGHDRAGDSRAAVEAFEKSLIAPPTLPPLDEEAKDDGSFPPFVIEVELADERMLPLLVLVPPDYDPSRRWPVMLAMHGGPTDSARSAFRGAVRMLDVWRTSAAKAGWVVAAPAMTHVVAHAARTADELPYEILRVDHMESLLGALTARVAVDPNRFVSTGISLGSNFSIAFAASRPDRFAAIVPVSTEGESRERLLRNLAHVPVFVLEGELDPNIRDIQGPRTMAHIETRLGHDIVYRELEKRGHESFSAFYPEVLEWLGERPRRAYPREIVRVPHRGIVPVARRVHWIESDTRRGLIRARATTRHRIEIEARWARSVRVFLTDHLVDLDHPVQIVVNGELMFEDRLDRSIAFAREGVAATNDPGRVYPASVSVDVPASLDSLVRARELAARFEPRAPAGTLSFWEMYAARALERWFPPLQMETTAISLEASTGTESAGLRVDAIAPGSLFHDAGVRAGDVLIGVDGEPFFSDSSVEELRHWLMREASPVARDIRVEVKRGEEALAFHASLALDFAN